MLAVTGNPSSWIRDVAFAVYAGSIAIDSWAAQFSDRGRADTAFETKQDDSVQSVSRYQDKYGLWLSGISEVKVSSEARRQVRPERWRRTSGCRWYNTPNDFPKPPQTVVALRQKGKPWWAVWERAVKAVAVIFGVVAL